MIQSLLEEPPKLLRIGTIRKGKPKVEGQRPEDTNHFRLVTEDKEANGRFLATYGPAPLEINFILPFPRPDDNLIAFQESRDRKGLFCRCDGKWALLKRLHEGAYQSYEPGDLLCSNCKDNRWSGRLPIIIPQLERWVTVDVLTGSKYDIRNIKAELEAAYQYLSGMGADLRHCQFYLLRTPQTITATIKGERKRVTKSILHIEADFNTMKSFRKHFISNFGKRAEMLPGEKVILPDAPTDEIFYAVDEEAPSAPLYDQQTFLDDAEEASPLSHFDNPSMPFTFDITAFKGYLSDHGLFNLEADKAHSAFLNLCRSWLKTRRPGIKALTIETIPDDLWDDLTGFIARVIELANGNLFPFINHLIGPKIGELAKEDLEEHFEDLTTIR